MIYVSTIASATIEDCVFLRNDAVRRCNLKPVEPRIESAWSHSFFLKLTFIEPQGTSHG